MSGGPSPAEPEGEGKAGVAAVDRALAILLSFQDADAPLSLAEISRRTGFYKSTVLRLLASLENGALVERLENGTYALGWVVGRLGASYRQSLGLERRVRPVLRRLRGETGESASFYRRNEAVRVCLYREESRQMIRDHVAEGAVLPMDRGAAAHVLARFAAGPDPRAAGPGGLPVMSFGERDPEVAAMAVPVFGEADALIGALTVSGPISRLTRQRAASLAPVLLREGRELSMHMGATGAAPLYVP